MLADDVYDGNLCAAGVVQIRDSVRQAGPKMQQRAGRFFSHSRVAVRCSGHDTFEKAQYAAHFGHPVERRDHVHF